MLPIVGRGPGFVVREVARSVIGSFTLPFKAYFQLNSLASERFMQTLVKRFLATFAIMVEEATGLRRNGSLALITAVHLVGLARDYRQKQTGVLGQRERV